MSHSERTANTTGEARRSPSSGPLLASELTLLFRRRKARVQA